MANPLLRLCVRCVVVLLCVVLSCVVVCCCVVVVCCCGWVVCVVVPEPPPLDRPKFRSFFPSPATVSFLFSLFGCLLVEFWWCLKRRSPSMCTFGLSGCRSETPAASGTGVANRVPNNPVSLDSSLRPHFKKVPGGAQQLDLRARQQSICARCSREEQTLNC